MAIAFGRQIAYSNIFKLRLNEIYVSEHGD